MMTAISLRNTIIAFYSIPVNRSGLPKVCNAAAPDPEVRSHIFTNNETLNDVVEHLTNTIYGGIIFL